MFATIAANRSDNDVVRLLERMRAVAGPVWQAHLVSVARLTFNGSPAVVSTESEGLRVMVRHCTGEICDGSYFNGERLYSFNMNGTSIARSNQPEDYLRALRLVGSLTFLSPSFLAHGGRIGAAGTATMNGKAYRTLAMGDGIAFPLRIYVDPQSALIRFARPLLGGRDVFEYRNYRRVGAFTLPFEVLHNGRVFERYDDRAVVSSALHVPRGLVPSFSGVPQAVATDPRAVTPIVECSVGGVAVRCLIDSGNSSISMSSELAGRLGAPVVGTYQVRGLGGYTTQVVRAGPLRVGNATYPDSYYIVLNDLRRYGYDIVLGADVLTSGIEIDSAAHLVRFGSAAARGGITVPLSFENFIPVVSVGLGAIEAQLAVDTGDESNINLAYDFYAKHPGLFTITTRRSVGGIGGNSIEMMGEIPQVRIGDYRTGPQRIGTTQTLQGTAFGHLGAAFLDQFIVQLDYAAAQLHLIPRRT